MDFFDLDRQTSTCQLLLRLLLFFLPVCLPTCLLISDRNVFGLKRERERDRERGRGSFFLIKRRLICIIIMMTYERRESLVERAFYHAFPGILECTTLRTICKDKKSYLFDIHLHRHLHRHHHHHYRHHHHHHS